MKTKDRKKAKARPDSSLKSPAAKSQKIEVVEPAKIEGNQLILTDKHKALIQKQIAPTATKEELELFFMMAYRTRLDPLLKQLYFIKYRDKYGSEKAGCACGYQKCTCGKSVYSVSYVTSIDGYRIIAHRTGLFDGIDEPEYKYVNNKLYSCTVKVYKKGCGHAFSATVKFSEYNTGKNLWVTKPETMIAKVGEAHALRKAVPQDLSGIYTTDEMDQAKQQQPAQGPQNRALPPKIPAKPPMIIKAQLNDIKFLMEQKDIGTAKLKYFVQRAFGPELDTMTKLTQVQARKLIKVLDNIEVEKPESKDEISAQAEEVFGTKSEDVDPDEADEGIKKMRRKNKDKTLPKDVH